MNAHRLVIIAAALTIAVAAALAVALATFSGQALPRAVRHDLGQATGTPLLAQRQRQRRPGAPSTPPSCRADLLGAGRHGVRLLPGRLVRPARVRARLARPPPRPARATPRSPRRPRSAASPPRPQLVSGSWPGAPGRRPAHPRRPAGLGRRAAARDAPATCCGCGTGSPRHDVRFVVTGLYRPRQVSVAVLGAGPDRDVRVEHGQRLHHLRPARRAGRGLRRAARRQPGHLAGRAADGQHSRQPAHRRRRERDRPAGSAGRAPSSSRA